jgi:hypothetical protein
MGSKLLTGAWWITAASLLLGCSEGRDSSDNLIPRPVPYFERVDISGVTTDHASTGGVSWVDYDGDLDVFITNQQSSSDYFAN